MPVYQRQGKIPNKRHVVFRNNSGGLYHEELFGTEGFSGTSSLIYHLNPPTLVKAMGDPYSVRPVAALEDNLKAMSVLTFDSSPADDYLDSRKTLFFNDDLQIAIARPKRSMKDYFFKNADSDELIFIHKGNGVVKTMYGTVEFEYGDYVVIPRGTVYQMKFVSADNHLLIIESHSPVRTPKRYQNEFGQLLEHSPFCERDFKLPVNFETKDEKGEFLIKIKKGD